MSIIIIKELIAVDLNKPTRKILFFNDIDSVYIEQAIFILRDKPVIKSGNALTEAERIVNEYISAPVPIVLKKYKKKNSLAAAVGIVCFAAALLATVIYFIGG